MRIDQFISGGAVDLLGDALFLTSLDGSIVDANSTAMENYGYSRDEICALHVSDLRVPQDPAAAVCEIREAASSKACFETDHRRSDGTPFPVEARAAEVSLGDEGALLVWARDITARKGAEAALAESEGRFRAVFESTSEGIFLLSFDGSIVWLNESMARMHGYTVDEMLAMALGELDAPEQASKAPERLQRVFNGETLSFVTEHFCKDGEIVPLEVTANLVAFGGENYVLAFHRDITHRMRVENDMRALNEDLEQRAEERTVLLNRLSDMVTSVIDVVDNVSEMRDPYTAGHQRRVAELAAAIAREMGMPDADIDDIRFAGMMHDIGKMAIPAEILSKPTELSPTELSLIQGHAEAGYSIIRSAQMHGPIADFIHEHHERCDGSGYPRGLRADELLVGSKVLMVADVVESMMSHRPYRAALGADAALEEVERGAGVLYDSHVASACIRLFRERGFSLLEL